MRITVLNALNRDPDNMQVITSQTDFAIEIPWAST
jgi:hypothetical protein